METGNHENVCRNCGGTEFAEGKMDGYSVVRPVDKMMSMGSPLLLNICKKCGEVRSMRVMKPEKFY
ncbi:hypothetical protein [Falsibacillus albus]|uniref:Transcription initiation factor TFIIIB n=1 Tax=Falsibacillus albus TaxID=2478915 RepID=A0A3L7JU20_9BACI|nr:hypothetical protein [Falsibacillus albus]RLQ93774.1 hypothetical protein D9X91_15995 [Falsibacillus albus]